MGSNAGRHRKIDLRSVLGAVAFGIFTAAVITENAPRVVRLLENKPVYYSGCNAARAAGVTPIYSWEQGYRPEMDGDDDGVACEPHR